MNRRSFLESTTLGAAGLVLARTADAAAQSAPASVARPARASAVPVVETTAGRVRGYVANKVYAFRGIPYAASTAGANRFQPPRKPQPWSRVRDVLDIGPRAPQLNAPRVPEWFVMDRSEPQSEDCLHVNVWTNSLNDGQKRPVMVWLHGGGFTGGSAGFTVYDGANLARRHNVVVVGVNHRLNLFGFLYLGDIGGERYADGNVGMLDVVAALEWVRDNIASFGGDPANVTVFGQSGGGSKVSTLFGMPAAKGLFHRGIAMSGSQVRSIPRDQATRTAETVLARLNIRASQLEDLQKVSMRQLRDLLGEGAGAPGGGLNFAPVVDGRTIPSHIFDPAASEIGADVPLLIGSTETEQTWNPNQIYDPLSDAELHEDVMRALRTDASGAMHAIATYRKNRPKASNLDLYLILISDASNFRVGTDTQADRKAAQRRAPVYKYYFQWYSPVRGGELRSMHTMDVPFAFYNHDIAASELGAGTEQHAFAEKHSTAMVAFARSGSPNCRVIPAWPAYDTTTRATMVMNNEWQVVNNPYGEERGVVAAVSGRAQPRRSTAD